MWVSTKTANGRELVGWQLLWNEYGQVDHAEITRSSLMKLINLFIIIHIITTKPAITVSLVEFMRTDVLLKSEY